MKRQIYLAYDGSINADWLSRYAIRMAAALHRRRIPLCRSASGITLASIFLMQIGNLIGRRSMYRSGLDKGIFANRLLLAGILIQIVFAWGGLYFPALQQAMHTGPVAPEIFALAWLGILWIFGLDYLRKYLVRHRHETFHSAEKI